MKEYSLQAKECLKRLTNEVGTNGLPTKEDIELLVTLATTEKNSIYTYIANYYQAIYAVRTADQENAMKCLMEAIRGLEESEEYVMTARAYNLMGVLFHGGDDLVSAVEYYNKSVTICDVHDIQYEKRVAIANVADVYYRIGDLEESCRQYAYCLQMYQIHVKEDSRREQWNHTLCLANFGFCLLQKGDVDAATNVEHEVRRRMAYGYPMLPVNTFLAAMSYERGEWMKAGIYMDVALDSVDWCNTSEEETEAYLKKILAQIDNLAEVLKLLIQVKDEKRIRRILALLHPLFMDETCESAVFQILFYKVRYCKDYLDQPDYLSSVHHFFLLQEKRSLKEYEKVLQAAEFRNKLASLSDEEQYIREQNEALLERALHDDLTGLANRRYYNEHSELLFSKSKRQKEVFAALLIDIDFYKEYNDTYGHGKGDKCIKKVAGVLQNITDTEYGFVARYGGDEFIIMMSGKNRQEVMSVAKNTEEQIRSLRIEHKGAAEGIVTATIGGACGVPTATDHVWSYMTRADEALYIQKEEKRGGYRIALQ